MSSILNKCEDDCPICLEELKYDIAVLNCKHEYHFKCIQLWYAKKNKDGKHLNCPMCHNEYAEIVNVVRPKPIVKHHYVKKTEEPIKSIINCVIQ